MDKFKYILSAIGGVIATLTNQYALILVFVIISIVFDVITGLIKAKVTGTGWSSAKGTAGFWKKISFLVALFFGIFLDYFIPSMLEVISIELPFNSPFGLMVGVYIVLNESISICENLYTINPESLPQWLIKFIKNTADKLNNKEDK